MTELPRTMKQWGFSRLGKASEVLELKTDVPVPRSPKAGEIMVRVSHVTTNPGDYKFMGLWIPCRLPATPGMDFVGEVVSIGPGSSTHLRPGMTVAGSMPIWWIIRGSGTLAEYILIPAKAVAMKPQGLEDAAAAGLLGIAGQTTATILRAAKVRRGDKVLLNGASGGVGLILTQVLAGMGVHITGVCSARNEALVRRLGANEIIDYTKHNDLYRHLSTICETVGSHKFDVVIDCVGDAELWNRSARYLKSSGKLITIEGTFVAEIKAKWMPVMFGGSARSYKSIMTFPSGELAKEAASWCDHGWIKDIPIDSVFSMDNVRQAYDKQATGRASGKIAVRLG